ncbi:hypothetical protein TNCV_780481 [Trichonephila clavipes]|nr:hypothetical protein TNCV_780481 [Trichonephila clavipes]
MPHVTAQVWSPRCTDARIGHVFTITEEFLRPISPAAITVTTQILWEQCVALSKDRTEAFTTGSPHTNTSVITAEIESGFFVKNDLVSFLCSQISSCVAPLQAEASMGRRQAGKSHNGHRDLKCPSARRLHMVREDTGVPNEDVPVHGWRPMKQLAIRIDFLHNQSGLIDELLA